MSKFVDDFKFNFDAWKKRMKNRLRNPNGVYAGGRGFPIGAVTMMVMGLLFIFCPLIISAAASIVLGSLITLMGVGTLISYIRFRVHQPFGAVSLVSGILLVITGVMFIINPLSLIKTISFMLGFFFAFSGGMTFNRLLKFKRTHMPTWWFKTILSGLLCLGGIVIILYPYTGVDLLFTFCGVALIINGAQKLFAV